LRFAKIIGGLVFAALSIGLIVWLVALLRAEDATAGLTWWMQIVFGAALLVLFGLLAVRLLHAGFLGPRGEANPPGGTKPPEQRE
jgi:hypothetical protein